MADKRSILPGPGERALIVGQTGSGKTGFLCWVLLRVPMSPVIIYETKEESKFQAFPGVVYCNTQDELDAAYADQAADYIVMQPDIVSCSDPHALDAMLYHHYLNYPNSVAAIDEIYMFHKNGRHLPGLLGLYTRGRSRGITTIACTQRPAWISGFTISEAQRYYAFYLQKKDDRKKLDERLTDLPPPPKHGFYYWESGPDAEITKYGPVKLDKGLDTGYIEQAGAGEPLGNPEPDAVKPDTARSKKRGATFI